ncbi:hypothetical protein [Tunturiibacter gelidiferens]|uniref:hypothetical protein n=1 Tax=Tunturiibacter gelidiferens TaxID=3069689 RepID=UPI003D9AB721
MAHFFCLRNVVPENHVHHAFHHNLTTFSPPSAAENLEKPLQNGANTTSVYIIQSLLKGTLLGFQRFDWIDSSSAARWQISWQSQPLRPGQPGQQRTSGDRAESEPWLPVL